MNEDIAERFMRYARIDSEADTNSTSYPSSEKQKDLGRVRKVTQVMGELHGHYGAVMQGKHGLTK